MKCIKKFFNNLSRNGLLAYMVALLCVACCLPSANAASNGCDVEDNTYVNAELALCNTHVYNIGDVTNPKTDADRQLMRDVVALKTTVMTQQMYKQYEYMDAMIRRFKTQLKKAVLTTSLQAAGAADENGNTGGYSSSGGGGTGGDRNIYMAGVQNCDNILEPVKVFECLNTNLNTISNASSNGANVTIELRKQLANDFNAAVSGTSRDRGAKGIDNTSAVKDCTDYKQTSQRKQFQACMDELRRIVRDRYNEELRNSKQLQQKQ